MKISSGIQILRHVLTNDVQRNQFCVFAHTQKIDNLSDIDLTDFFVNLIAKT
ncbi:hypothetical protein [Acinetobacter oleivorans]|uniref:hypothetical protein n=1 Tax=Acinetobacter oleivorans TaxID=1148157 RepID=UPI003F7B9200